MTPAEARAKETREWMIKASDDLASARILADTIHLANALFLCQQAAEKSMKGFLAWHQIPFRRTHDLEELGEACAAKDGTLSALVEQADALSDYAWKLRYPGAPYTPEAEETEAMFALACTMFREIQARLPKEACVSQGSGNHE
jgi:HEPN domain-containing protein